MLVLASASQARHQLLEKAEIPHSIIISNFNESSVKNKNPKELSKELAYAKANAVSHNVFNKKDLLESIETIYILGCDSIFEFEGKILGKPRDKQEAIRRLLLMSNKSGTLHTGHSLIILKKSNGNHVKTFRSKVISTIVQFCNLEKNEIKAYVDKGKVLNCAGGFTLEGEGSKFIKSINGCYSNVIGLSIPWIKENLKD